MGIWDIVIIVALAVWVLLVARSIRRRKREGGGLCSGCSGSCGGCSAGACKNRQNASEKDSNAV